MNTRAANAIKPRLMIQLEKDKDGIPLSMSVFEMPDLTMSHPYVVIFTHGEKSDEQPCESLVEAKIRLRMNWRKNFPDDASALELVDLDKTQSIGEEGAVLFTIN